MNLSIKLGRGAIVACVIAAGGLATAGVVVAGTVGLTPAPEQPPVKSVPAEISAAFGVFRKSQVAADSSQGVVSGSTTSGPGVAEALGHAGANVFLSRHVGPAGSGLFATVGRERVCLYAEGESSCAEPAVALKGEMISYDVCSSGLPAGHIHVSGLVLDGVVSVVLKDSGGNESVIPVRENGFSTLVSGHVIEMEWAKEGVAHKVPINYPDNINCVG